MSGTPRVRFAPSPTGPLHIGGVRTALYNYLFAKHTGGQMILRIEDTDQTRYVPGAEAYIIEALNWLGITFDEGPHVGGPHAPYRQSERKAMYRQYADQLVEAGWAYYAFDTPEELEAMRERGKQAGLKSVQYNAITREHMANSLALPADEVQRRLDEGQDYVIRFKVPRKEEVRFEDQVRSWVVVHTSQMDDKVLLKSDGMPTYHLANVVDDHLMEITHVIRGEEWLPSTPLHLLLYQAFGWNMPKMAHLPLLLKPDGNGKLSKRDGDALGFPVFPTFWQHPQTGETARGYREDGYLPEALVNFLALLGWNPGGDEEVMDMNRLIELFTLDRVGKSGVKFNYEKGIWFNQTYLRQKPLSYFVPVLKEQLDANGLAIPTDDYLEQAAALLLDRISFLHELYTHGDFLFKDPEAYDEKAVAKRWSADAAQLMTALQQAFAGLAEWKADGIQESFNQTAEALELKPGKFMPALRLAISGQPSGPEMFPMIELLGKEAVVRRLGKAVAHLA